SSPEALKRTLLAAKSITYSDPANGGASGIHFANVLERLGIVNEIKPKTLLAKPGDETAGWVANGKAEIGVHQIQVLRSVAGVEIVGYPVICRTPSFLRRQSCVALRMPAHRRRWLISYTPKQRQP